MNQLKKTITLGLLLPILTLNFPSGMLNFCRSNMAMEPMPCCSARHSPLEDTAEDTAVYLTSQTCVCQISENSQTDESVAILVEISKPNSQKVDEHFVNVPPRLPTILNLLISYKHFDSNSLPRAFSNLKIYELVSSYRI